jgi:aspartate carbamoyltransferase regulatory subunit
MIIGQIKNGIVLDHITADRGWNCTVFWVWMSFAVRLRMIKKSREHKLGRKGLYKIDRIDR